MAVKQVFVSDISGREIAEGKNAKIVVYEHPCLEGSPVELDVDASEAAGIENGKLPIVSLKIIEPGRPQGRRVILDVTTFNQLFPEQEVEQLLGRARQAAGVARGRAGRAPDGAAAGPNGETPEPLERAVRSDRVNYSDPEYAGTLHRGRVTEAEKEFVRQNLDVANANRQRAGQPPIDPDDPKEKQRYNL